MRERGLLGAAKINKDLQEVYLTQGILRGESFGVGESIYRGDKVDVEHPFSALERRRFHRNWN